MEQTRILTDRQDGYHIISLGAFCGPAQELERCGLRDSSYPFDWLISSSFESVLELIQNGFTDFLRVDELYQSVNNRNFYYNEKTKVWFYHDFSERFSLEEQWKPVNDKYNRRIERFYKTIAEPTIFIRYILDMDDAAYINVNEEHILSILKSYCSENQIIYIYNDDLEVCLKDAYPVKKDEGDTASRVFMKQLPELENFLRENYKNKNQIEDNIARYEKNLRKKHKKNNLIRRCVHKVKRLFEKEYHHYKEI